MLFKHDILLLIGHGFDSKQASEGKDMGRPKWKSIPFLPALGGSVPGEPGIYAVVRHPRVLGLPIEHRVLYVGRSRNLRRRFSQHVRPWSQHSRLLNPAENDGSWEFWFAPMPEADLAPLEYELIRQVQPCANVHMKGDRR